MAEEKPVVCSACHYILGDAEEELEHPDDPDPPEDAHFRVQIRDDGEERLQCTKSGKLAKPLGRDDDGYPHEKFEEGEGSGSPQPEADSDSESEPTQQPQSQGQPTQNPQQRQSSQQQSQNGPVYNIEEEKDQMDILAEVVTNPSYGLSDEQVQEIRAWALDYGGQMPPDALEEIAKLMSGVAKQTAQLMRERYELKLNNWIRERTQQDDGPGIGAGRIPKQGMGVPRGSADRDIQTGPSPEALQAVQQQEQQQQQRGEPDSVRESSRKRREDRQERRKEAAKKAIDELAVGTAENISSEAGKGLVRLRNIGFKVIEAKAEKDPEWFFELAERLDIDVMELLEPSEARKQERDREKGRAQSEVDNEVDSALAGLQGGTGQSQPQQNVEMSPETVDTTTPNNPQTDNQLEGSEMDTDNPELEEEEDEMFDEIFGGN